MEYCACGEPSEFTLHGPRFLVQYLCRECFMALRLRLLMEIYNDMEEQDEW